MKAVLEAAWLIARKDFKVESRSRELIYTSLFFAVSCVLVFSFAFVRGGQAVDNAAAGILWVAIAFSGTLALGRTFERERQSETLRALLLAPVERPAIYLGKLLGMLILLVGIEVVLVPMVAFLFQAPLDRAQALFAGILLTGTLGSSRWARSSRPCWSGRSHATCCCRSCFIPSRSRRSSAACRARRLSSRLNPILRSQGHGSRCWYSSSRCRSGRSAP
jgi:hypothetical protein